MRGTDNNVTIREGPTKKSETWPTVLGICGIHWSNDPGKLTEEVRDRPRWSRGLGVWTKQCSPSGTWGLDKTMFFLHPLGLGFYAGHQCQQCSVSTLWDLGFGQNSVLSPHSVNSVLSPPSPTWPLYRSSVSTVFCLHSLRIGFYTDHQCQ